MMTIMPLVTAMCRIIWSYVKTNVYLALLSILDFVVLFDRLGIATNNFLLVLHFKSASNRQFYTLPFFWFWFYKRKFHFTCMRFIIIKIYRYFHESYFYNLCLYIYGRQDCHFWDDIDTSSGPVLSVYLIH